MTKKNTQEECVTNLKSHHSKHENWSNTDNINIYKNMPIEAFYQIAIQSGLDTGVDVKTIKKYIRNANSILEIGAGYGRVLAHILNQGYQGKLVAVERNQRFCQFLQSQFYGRADIICDDVANFKTDEKFDLILWMWTGIFEFSKTEQSQMISYLSKLLSKKGYLILDTVSVDFVSINAFGATPNDRIIKTSYGKDYCYFPSDDEIMQYVQYAGLVHHEDLFYSALVNRKRRLSVFSLG
ncbi:MAG: class I SAM-dependent methyltransferase [Gammaproteobacteria bacterium]|jgi:SAM-dependent methyltransferase